jgi:peroxiredoxin
MKRLFHIVILLFAFQEANAQVVIQGVAPGFIGQEVRIVKVTDYISMNEVVLANGWVGTDSLFKVSFPLKSTTALQLCLGNTCAPLYAFPDKIYNVLFPEPENKVGYNLSKTQVQLIFEDLPKDDINFLILQFDYWVDDFFAVTLTEIADADWRKSLDTFKLYVSEYYSKVTDRFFMDYVTYRIANIERIGHAKEDREQNKARVFINYLYQKPVLADHPMYMDFFNDFYLNNFLLSTRTFERSLYQQIQANNLQGIRELIGPDPYTGDPELLEYVLLKGLLDLYKNGEFPREKVSEMIRTVSLSGKTENIKTIAANVYNRLTKMKPGTPFPDFKLPSVQGDSGCIADYKGKYVYLTFFSLQCTSCISEMNIMPDLRARYGDDFVFISVAVDGTSEDLKNFAIKNRQVNWPLLHITGKRSLLEQYQIVTLPYYILIDREGNIIDAPAYAPTPSGNYVSIDKTFYDLKKRDNE